MRGEVGLGKRHGKESISENSISHVSPQLLPMPIHTDSTLHVCTRHINRNIQVHIISHDNGPHTPTGT